MTAEHRGTEFEDSPAGLGPIADQDCRQAADALEDWETWMDDDLLEAVSNAWQKEFALSQEEKVTGTEFKFE